MTTTAQLARQYAKVLARAARMHGVDDEVLLKNLIAHLRTKGRLKLLPDIARALRTLASRESTAEAVVEVAREEDTASAIAAANAAGITATQATVNSTLIRGWRAHTKGTLIDRSAKRTLVELYRTIIH